jgi:hypothetical protein
MGAIAPWLIQSQLARRSFARAHCKRSLAPMEALAGAIRVLAGIRRYSRTGAYAVVAALPAIGTLVTVWWKYANRRDKMRLLHNEGDDKARAVARALEGVSEYRPTPWALVSSSRIGSGGGRPN